MPNKQNTSRKLRAIFSADVKGYSLLMANNELETVQTLKKYRDIMSSCIEHHEGRVVDAVGDNLLAEFESAVDAVQCAVEIQDVLKIKNQNLPDEKKLEFRIGINIGDVIHDGERIFGDGVNVAARIESLAEAGGVCISRNTYDQIKNKLKFGYDYLGEHEVKNIKEPVRVYKVILGSDLPATLADEPLELPDKPSIAVLPFVNMSGDDSHEYFSDGLTEQIINGLCKVLNLFVIARNSSFFYKGKSLNVQQIGKELGVRYILEGSVQKAANRVRITAQLIDAATGYHLWSENYDRDLSDIFALQDEITLKIIDALQIKLTWGEQARLWEGATSNIQAFDKYVRGQDCFFRTNEKDNKQARHFFEEAINIDNDYSLAYVMLGYTHLMDIFLGWSKSSVESFEKAEKNVDKALSLNDSIDLAYCLLGWILLFKRQHEEAIKAVEKAIDISPNGAIAHAHLAFILVFSDEIELANKMIKRAFRLNPIPQPYFYDILAMTYRNTEQYEKTIEVCKKALSGNPDSLGTYIMLAASYSALNRTEDARNAVDEIFRINPGFSLENYANTLPHKNKEKLDKFVSSLRKAGLSEWTR